jgi:hypothetical protein
MDIEKATFFDTFTKEVLQADFTLDNRIKNSGFRKFIIKTHGKTVSTINILRDSLAITIKKPQRCLYADQDWYLAIDTYTSTFYVCYRDLMMIDIDYGKGNQYTTYKEVINMLQLYCDKNPTVLMDIYQSGKGVHVFMLHQKYDYHLDRSLELMLELECDFYYVIYSSLRGWSVRVNSKIGESKPIYKSLGRIGTGSPINRLECLVKVHINFLTTFADVTESKMY